LAGCPNRGAKAFQIRERVTRSQPHSRICQQVSANCSEMRPHLSRLIAERRTGVMKRHATIRSIGVVTFIGLLRLVTAVAFVQYVAAEGERTLAAPGGDAVTLWNANAGVAATAACIAPIDNPLHESRIYAMMHVDIHDALNAIDSQSRPYTFDMQAEPGASPDAAVAAAARDVLVPLIAQLPLELLPQSCIDAGVASVEADYIAALAAISDGQAKVQGIAV